MLLACHNQVVSCKLQTTTQAIDSCCVKKHITFLGIARKRILNQLDTCTWKSFVFKKSQVFPFPTTDNYWSFNFLLLILQDSRCFLCFPNWNFAQEIGVLLNSLTFDCCVQATCLRNKGAMVMRQFRAYPSQCYSPLSHFLGQ